MIVASNRRCCFAGAVIAHLPTIINCSAIGPSANAGTKVNAPTRMTTPTNSSTNSGVCVGSVPTLMGVAFFLAIDPAIAKVGITNQ